MNQIYPERITQARELLGMTKTELAQVLGVSPAAVAQWENGTKNPAPFNLTRLSSHLGFPLSTLLRPMPVWYARKGPISFRATKTAETRRRNLQAEQLAGLVAETFSWLSQKVRLPDENLPELESEEGHYNSPEEAAALCRKYWGLGLRPILKLGELLEANGIIVVRAEFNDLGVDAFSCLIAGRPFIFLGKEKNDRARSRFDAAHELGHLIMHQHLSAKHLSELPNHDKLEQEANRFASAFLMPDETFKNDIVEVSLNSLLALKERWGASVQAMVMTCHALGLIDDRRKIELYRQMSGKGWRRAQGEPFDDRVPEVKSSIGKLSLELLEKTGALKNNELIKQMPMPVDVYTTAFGVERERFEGEESENVVDFDVSLHLSVETPDDTSSRIS